MGVKAGRLKFQMSRLMAKWFTSSSRSVGAKLKKTRVLFLRRTTAFGGSEMVILNLLKAIDYERTIVSIASPVDVFSKLLKDLKLPVRCLPLTAPFAGNFCRAFFAWISYFVPLRPDKIILAEGAFRNFPLSTALAAFVSARGNVWMMQLHTAPERAPEHSERHFGFIPSLGLYERARFSLTRGVLCVSQGVKDRLMLGYRYDPEKMSVVYAGVDTKRFSPIPHDIRRALRKNLEIPDEGTVIVSAARLDSNKRLDRLIHAFGALSFEHPNLWLLLTGDGPLRDELRALARSVNHRENIRFLGYVDDVCVILRLSDIYVLPSDEEGFGLALAEAMACELVCVATKTVGPSEIVEDGINGFLTDRTYDGVQNGVGRALRLSSNERKEMGRRARQRVVHNFRVEEAAAKGLAFLKIDRTAGNFCDLRPNTSSSSKATL